MLSELKLELEALALVQGRELFVSRGRKRGQIELHGKKLKDFTNWDIFGLNHDPTFLKTIHAGVERFGLGSTSPRLFGGTSEVHQSCERRFSQYFGCESTLLFSSKNQAVISLMNAILGEKDCVVVDESVQSPIIDAANVTKSEVKFFSYDDPNSLNGVLARLEGQRRIIVVAESLSPVTGKVVDLKAISTIAQRYKAQLIVDESFGFGTLGLRGSGGVELFTLEREILCRFLDLSRTIAGFGAIISGPLTLIDFLIQRSRTLILEAAPPPLLCLAAEAAIDLIELKTIDRERIKASSNRLRRGIAEMSKSVSISDDGPIVCIKVSTPQISKEVARHLLGKGFFVEHFAISNRTKEFGLIRLIVNLAHSEKDIDCLLQALSEILPRIKEL